MRRALARLGVAASRPRRYALIMGLALALAGLMAQTAAYGDLKRWLEDTVMAITAEPVRFEDVLVVDIDEGSMAALAPALGAWPYARDAYAPVVRYLLGAGARAVVLDILFTEPRGGDDVLGAALAGAPPGAAVWLAARGQDFPLARDAAWFERLDRHRWPGAQGVPAQHWRDLLLPVEALGGGDTGVGIISVVPDADGVLRRVSLLHEAYGRVLPGMPLASLFRPGEQPPVVRRDGHIAVGAREWPVDDAGQVALRIPRNRDFLPVVGFEAAHAVAAGAGTVPAALMPGRLRGRTVFIGSSAAVLGDYARLPLHGRTAGLAILALGFASLAHDRVLAPDTVVIDLVLVLLAAALPLLLTNRRACTELLISGGALLGMLSAATAHVALFGWWAQRSDLAFALLLGGLVLLVQLALRFRTLYEDRRQLWFEKRAADEANELKSRFLAHMTHELRTPLTAIVGYNRLLAEPGAGEAERRERVAVVDRNCGHLLALINNLLDQARIEAGQMSVEREPTAIRELLEDVRSTLAPLAAEKGLQLELHCADAVPEALHVDPLRVKQILLNLVGNALKFTARGAVRVDVDHGLDGATQQLSLAVSDTGPGMSPAALARVFDAFQQADGTVARRHGGTGLGLTISRNLAALMGGGIEVRSVEGQGSCFTARVHAPRAEAPRRDSGAEDAENPEAAAGARVLLVDDSEDIRELVALHLRRLGAVVSTAVDGEAGVAAALAQAPDVVLMDVEMPRMDGVQATRRLRAAGYEGRIVALTAHGDDGQLARLAEAGSDAVVGKPVSRARLAGVLAEQLGRRRATG